MTTPMFELRGVTVTYEDVVALDAIDLALPRACRVALLGPNGSGKSTLLMLIDALTFQSRGTFLFDGSEMSENAMRSRATATDFRRRVGFVFQNPDVQLFNPTVYDELAFSPLQLGWPEAQVRAAVERTLESMDLAHLATRATYRLSLGEKKRVSIASVLVTDPDVVLLDEPTAGLDPRSQSRVIDMLVGWQGSGKTIVTATHDLDLVEDIADHCVVLDAGRAVAEGAPAAILADTELLERTGLVHVHQHTHDGSMHRHPHRHRHSSHHSHE